MVGAFRKSIMARRRSIETYLLKGPLCVGELDGTITGNEVVRVLKNMKDGKATGVDGIPIEFWKRPRE